MATPALNTLPADILYLISQYLDTETLKSLALIDKQSHSAACNVLFHTITIKTHALNANIENWISMLQHRSLWGVVRHLRIDGSLPSGIFNVHLQQEEIDDAPLMDLLSRLTALTRLSWACAEQFPEAVLDILKQRFPSCRLHLEVFRLFSIYDQSQEPYERKLMSSPSLHAIHYSRTNSDCWRDDRQRIFRHIVGLAPNLRALEGNGRGKDIMVSPTKNTSSRKEYSWLD